MANFDSIIANIKFDFEKYDSAGQVNEHRIYQDAIRVLRRFGNDMGVIKDTFIDVVGGTADLPNDFYNLIHAYKCDPDTYHSTVENHELQTTYFYKERITNIDEWSDCESCCNKAGENIVQEKVYFTTGNLTFNYKNPTLIKLVKDVHTFKYCPRTCQNLFVKDSTYHMKIQEETLYTNFEKGHIYIKYYGLPTDSEGNIDIPDSKNGHLHEYIELHLKRKLMERLITNIDAQPGLANMYQVIVRQEEIALRNAANELKMTKISPRSLSNKIQKINRLEVLQYEINTPWL